LQSENEDQAVTKDERGKKISAKFLLNDTFDFEEGRWNELTLIIGAQQKIHYCYQ
jgi:predicted GNAT family N-acyltransferase